MERRGRTIIGNAPRRVEHHVIKEQRAGVEVEGLPRWAQHEDGQPPVATQEAEAERGTLHSAKLSLGSIEEHLVGRA